MGHVHVGRPVPRDSSSFPAGHFDTALRALTPRWGVQSKLFGTHQPRWRPSVVAALCKGRCCRIGSALANRPRVAEPTVLADRCTNLPLTGLNDRSLLRIARMRCGAACPAAGEFHPGRLGDAVVARGHECSRHRLLTRPSCVLRQPDPELASTEHSDPECRPGLAQYGELAPEVATRLPAGASAVPAAPRCAIPGE